MLGVGRHTSSSGGGMTPKDSPGRYPDHDPDLFLDLVRDRLARQHDTIDALDGKISQLFALSTGLLGILAAVFALTGKSLNVLQWLVVSLAVATYVFVAVQSFGAYRERAWFVGISLRQLWNRMHKGNEDDRLIKWMAANSLRSAYEGNLDAVRAKSDVLPSIFKGVILQTALVVLALILVVADR
jgi:hypothetical protein